MPLATHFHTVVPYLLHFKFILLLNVAHRMRLALVSFERIQERLSEFSLDVKGKLNSWMEGGLEHSGLVQGVKLMLEKLDQARPSLQNPRELTGGTGSPRETLIRVNITLHGSYMVAWASAGGGSGGVS